MGDIYVKDNNIQKKVQQAYIKENGVWKCATPYLKQNGVWNENAFIKGFLYLKDYSKYVFCDYKLNPLLDILQYTNTEYAFENISYCEEGVCAVYKSTSTNTKKIICYNTKTKETISFNIDNIIGFFDRVTMINGVFFAIFVSNMMKTDNKINCEILNLNTKVKKQFVAQPSYYTYQQGDSINSNVNTFIIDGNIIFRYVTPVSSVSYNGVTEFYTLNSDGLQLGERDWIYFVRGSTSCTNIDSIKIAKADETNYSYIPTVKQYNFDKLKTENQYKYLHGKFTGQYEVMMEDTKNISYDYYTCYLKLSYISADLIENKINDLFTVGNHNIEEAYVHDYTITSNKIIITTTFSNRNNDTISNMYIYDFYNGVIGTRNTILNYMKYTSNHYDSIGGILDKSIKYITTNKNNTFVVYTHNNGNQIVYSLNIDTNKLTILNKINLTLQQLKELKIKTI